MTARSIRLTVAAIALVLSGQVPARADGSQAPASSAAQSDSGSLTIQAAKPGPVINRDIFGQFSEMLGEGIYGGVWVGNNSRIPNVRGIRSDVVAALRALKVPVVRWPGGCFADEYHWRNGVGPARARPATINSNWGGVIEPNSFGTHEFMDLVEQIGSEAYISVNLGTGTPKEAAEWLEYMTTDKPSALGADRVANGRKQPWRIKYLGLGNESWGCGGSMTADAYVDRMKLFSTFAKNFNPAQTSGAPSDILKSIAEGKFEPSMLDVPPQGMQRIAVGPDGAKTEYTEAVMKAWATKVPLFWGIEGLSLHFYTTGGGFPMSFASTDFGEKDYATLLQETLRMDALITTHSAIMDKYDPRKKVSLAVDEWGAWLRPVPGTNMMFLKQQSTMRDALIAALNINIFARHADRVRMANVAQMVNVIQSMILTDGEKMLLTPNYHVFRMYVPFQDARFLPVSFSPGVYTIGKISLPRVDAIAARGKDGNVWLALANLDPVNAAEVPVSVPGVAVRSVVGEVLTAAAFNTVNTFDAPAAVAPRPYSASAVDGKLVLQLPRHSVTVVRLEL